MTLILVSDQIVNLDNIVTFDIDNGFIVRIWYIGSSTPVTLQPPINANAIIVELRRKGLIQ
jgi:hypothetical protein